MKYLLVPIFAFLLIFSSCKKRHKNIRKVISTRKGKVAGSYNSKTDVYSFKGIPYAKPPVDSLRWRPPQPVNKWNDTLRAKKFGPICMQPKPRPISMWSREFMPPAGNISEGCLNLNIWTKKGPANAHRAVIVYIPGGGFISGSGSVPIYNGANMAQKGIVFVTINYRLGIFGFLAYPGLTNQSPHHTSGNYGLLDQIAALKWVQKNIAAFGGDPNNVTVAGQSAGSYSVNYLVASPLAKGLFQKAIAESGGTAMSPSNSISKAHTLSSAEKQGERAAKMLNANNISELRNVSADSLLKIEQKIGSFSPIVDGYVLPKSVHDLLKNGNYNNVPVLTGWNTHDGLIFPVKSPPAYRQSLKKRFGKYADDILQQFPATNDSIARKSQIHLNTILFAEIQSWEWMKLQNQTGGDKVYLYNFQKDVPHTANEKDYGAFHSGEILYAYDNFHESNRPFTSTDRKLKKTMSTYWANFARKGNPNGNGVPYWPPSNKQNNFQTMIFGDTVGHEQIPSLKDLQLLNKIFTKQMKKTQ